MCKELSTTILQEESKQLNGWDKAIYDAEQRIVRTKRRLSELKVLLAYFIEQRDSGEPWPGDEVTRAESEAA